MTCYKCGLPHTTVVCPTPDFRNEATGCYRNAAGCSPPLTDLSPEDAIRRGRGSDMEGWIEECNALRESVKVKDALLKKASTDMFALDAQVKMLKKVLETSREYRRTGTDTHGHCLDVAIREYYLVGNIFFGPGGD